jgi:hypothetical protein
MDIIWFYIISSLITIVVIIQYFFNTRGKIGYLLLLCCLGSLIAFELFFYIECTIKARQCEPGTLSIIGDVIFILIIFASSLILNILLNSKKRDR